MSAIASIDGLSNDSLESIDSQITRKSEWTDVRIHRIWLAASAGIAMASALGLGILAFTVQPLYIYAVIPLAIASGTLLYMCSRMYDFENPAELTKIRESAQKMTLPEIVDKYGWQPLFGYEILTPLQFETAFATHVNPLNFNRLITFYEKAVEELKVARMNYRGSHYTVPSPMNWKTKFEQETTKMNCSEIIDTYPVDKLGNYEVIGEKGRQIFSQIQSSSSQLAEQKKELEKEFSRRTQTERKLLEVKEQMAKKKYDPSSFHDEIPQLYANYLNCVQAEEKIAEIQLSSEKKLVDNLRKSLSLIPSPEEKRRLQAAQADCEMRSRAIRDALVIRIGSLYKGYEIGKGSLLTHIASLRHMEESEISAARLEFAAATKPFREAADQNFEKGEKAFQALLVELNQEYDRIRGK